MGRKRNAGMMGAGVARVPDGTARWLLLVPLLAFAGCATTTEEERVVGVVEEWHEAFDEGRLEDAWGLFSERARRFMDLSPEAPHVRMPVPGSGRERFLEFFRGDGEDAKPLPAVLPVEIEGDLARVPLTDRGVTFVLRKEAGAWRIEACGRTGEGDLMVFPGPDGREVACWGYVDLSRKPVKTVDLPEVPGAREANPGRADLLIRVAIDEQGGFWLRWERRDRIETLARLEELANRERDMSHPLRPSALPVFVAAHRDAPWSAVRDLLALCADGEVRIFSATFLTEEDERGNGEGFPAMLRAYHPVRVRVREPELLLRVTAAAATPDRLAALRPVLRERAEGLGVRVIFPDDLRWEDALRVLVTVAACGPREIVLGAPGATPPGELEPIDVPAESAGEPWEPGEVLPLPLRIDFR